ncbi:hypothetical protein QYM36_016647 [Artemia franciscana]|uniref:Uncharacterized protein n=1 Tax=Artemia franciscana TaxID=6661 RepID=A0AA88H429_ARTSF|nr:hypothetical protein QYM36_016647 [Artemia franciscana]
MTKSLKVGFLFSLACVTAADEIQNQERDDILRLGLLLSSLTEGIWGFDNEVGESYEIVNNSPSKTGQSYGALGSRPLGLQSGNWQSFATPYGVGQGYGMSFDLAPGYAKPFELGLEYGRPLGLSYGKPPVFGLVSAKPFGLGQGYGRPLVQMYGKPQGFGLGYGKPQIFGQSYGKPLGYAYGGFGKPGFGYGFSKPQFLPRPFQYMQYGLINRPYL